MNRAFLNLKVRAVNDELRELRGIATDNTIDRVGDTIDPLGCEWQKGGTVLLWQHLHDAPIGRVTFGAATKAGVPFVAKIAKPSEPGLLKNRCDEAWQAAKLKIVTDVSVGFRPLAEPSPRAGGGYHFPRVEILELSLVSVPANPNARILETRTAGKQRTGETSRRGVVKIDGIQTDAERDANCIPYRALSAPPGHISLEEHERHRKTVNALLLKDRKRGLIPYRQLSSPPGHISLAEHEKRRRTLNAIILASPVRGVVRLNKKGVVRLSDADKKGARR